jgi:phosphatidyl-myo-inositol alpha-mannosyltransferase
VRVGLVCPYSLDVPGGVQNHVRDLAETLTGWGHQTSVLAPADDDALLPAYVVPAGRAVPVPFNGSVARLVFGPVSASRVRRWIREGDFDLLHIHEPASPSVSLLALWAATGPIVATFHAANPRSRAMSAGSAILRPLMEKISARIAVSEEARATLVQHLGGEPVIIPNGLFVDRFAGAAVDPGWRSPAGTLAFLGRSDEPRKGLPVLLEAYGRIAGERPGVRLLVAGRSGDVEAAAARLPASSPSEVRFLGPVDEPTKAALLRSADVFVAPHTGGESFGMVLVEAMAAGAAVLASDLPAFRRVLADGRCGTLFDPGDADALAKQALALLSDDLRRAGLVEAAAREVRRYDWSTVGRRILDVYETVTLGAGRVGEDERARR